MEKLMQKLTFFIFLLTFAPEGHMYAAGRPTKRERQEEGSDYTTSRESSPSSADEALEETLGIIGTESMPSRCDRSLSLANNTMSNNPYESDFSHYSPLSPPPIKRKKECEPTRSTSPLSPLASLAKPVTISLPSNISMPSETTAVAVASQRMIPHGYGWMRRHPFTLLFAAFDNLVDTKANERKIVQQKLHKAVNSANTTLAAKALAEGANPNKIDAIGWSPLHYACADARCTEIITLMINYDADITKKTKQDKKRPSLAYGYTPLHIALENNNHAIVSILRAQLTKSPKV